MSQKTTEQIDGLLVIDKPSGITSHDVVQRVRRWAKQRRVGHLGTLDPLATGVLPLAVRNATKLVPFVQGSKVYWSRLRLGIETDTLDAEGQTVREFDGPLPEEADLAKALEAFVGEIQQIPPMYSAVKRQGVPLYRLARKGEEVERDPRTVHIDSIRLLSYEPPDVEIEVVCSPGTYVRVLAADLGTRLGCGGHLADLRRTGNGPFTIEQAVPPAVLEEEAREGKIEARLVPAAEGLGFPALKLNAGQVQRVLHGGEVRVASVAQEPIHGRYAGLDESGELLAVLEMGPAGMLRPVRVLRSLAAAD